MEVQTNHKDEIISKADFIFRLAKACRIRPVSGSDVNILKKRFDVAVNKVFSDVSGHRRAPYIEALQKAGIIDPRWYAMPGEYAVKLEPDEKLKKMEMVRMAVNALGLYEKALNLKGVKTGFENDREIEFRDSGFVALAAENKIIDKGGSFDGNAHVTVGEEERVLSIVTMLHKNPELVKELPDVNDFLWVGVMPFRLKWVNGEWENFGWGPQAMRPDWFDLVTDDKAWKTTMGYADVFKMYFNILPGMIHTSRHGYNESAKLTDQQLSSLASFLLKNRLKSAFELGGPRYMGPQFPFGQWGRMYALQEIQVGLRRWCCNGGKVDYITTDHGVFMNMDYFLTNHLLGDMTPDELFDKLLDELVDYFEVMNNEFPDAKLGCIESTGFFEVDEQYYISYYPKYKKKFNDYFEALLKKMNARGLKLDHFHIDCQPQDVRGDTSRNRGCIVDVNGNILYDFGKILLIEEYARRHKVKTGFITNAGSDALQYLPDGNKIISERLIEYFRQYFRANPISENVIFQSWSPYPDVVGPEDSMYSEMWLYKQLCKLPEFMQYAAQIRNHGK